jgi:hypothetical protein
MQVDPEVKDDAPAMPDEAQAELRALQAAADADPNELPDPNAPEPVAPPPPLDAELSAMLLMMSKVLAPAFPSIATIYTEESCGAVGAAVAGVCEKYGWLQGGVGGEYGPELMCLVVVGPIAFATYGAVQGDIAARRPKSGPPDDPDKRVRVQAPPGALRPPGADTVTVGAPIV